MIRRVYEVLARWLGQLNPRRPLHALLIGALVGGLVAPIFGYIAQQERYRLGDSVQPVLAHANPYLSAKLTADTSAHSIYFNRSGDTGAEDGLRLSAGGGGKKSSQLYSATLPDQASSGIKVVDTVNNVAVTMRPQFGLMDGRINDGHVVYPLSDAPGQLAFTPKANGLKEDILLAHYTTDRVEFSYNLDLPDSLVARLDADGSVGIYSGDPALFGNISYGTEADRAKVDLARKAADKTYLMFRIPAPTVNQADGQDHGVQARFSLTGSVLSVTASGLKAAAYPLSIDPTFVISTSSDFNLGRIEDNITVSAPGGTDGQINRASLSGGLAGAWGTAVAGNLPAGCSNSGTDYNFGLTAYNGFLYLVGGGNGATTYTCYVAINSNGTLGTWAAATNAFATGRTGASVVGYNGYIYVMGGETANGGTQFTTVEYAAIQSNGDLGTWATTSSANVGRAYFGAAVYNDFIYACGGATRKNNGTLVASCEYVNVKADGTLGTWTNTTSFTTARDRFGFLAYNNYLYIVGGFDGTSPLTSVQYAPLTSTGAIGTWAATTALAQARRSAGYAVEQGHIYAVAGCSTTTACSNLLSSTTYSPINADGTLGSWDTTTSITTARLYNGSASYNGVLYSIGGCSSEPTNNNNCASTEYGDSQYTVISGPGDVVTPAATTSITTARGGNAVVAYNGYMYSAGGCTGATCNTHSAVVDKAAVNDDGTLGTWTTTGMTALPAARYGGAMAAFNNKLYYCGGDASGTLKNDCLSSAVSATDGTNGAWSTETNNFSTQGARKLLTVSIWNNYLYLVGGTDNTTWYNQVLYSQIGSTGALGSFSTATSTFTTGRIGHGSAIYGGNLYVVGGQNSAGTALSDVQRASIDSSTGNITTGFTTDTALPAARTFLSVATHNNMLYVLGGMTSTTATSAVIYAQLDSSTGAISGWTTSAKTLVTSRQSFTAAAYKGFVYAVGGCTSGQTCSTYTATVDYGRLLNGGVGQTSSYTTPTAFTTARADMQSAVLNGYLYIVGGCTAYTAAACTTWTTSVQSAQLNPGGGLGTWTANTALPSSVGRSYGGAAVFNGYLYVIGGSISGTAEDRTVLYATANSSGTLTWNDHSGNYLPSGKGRYGFGTTASGGYIYVVGGVNGGANKTEVYYTKASTSSTTGDLSDPNACGGGTVWCTTTAFTTARRDLQAIAYNSVLYVIGGYDGTNALSDTQYAPINTDGTVGTWKYTTREDHGMRARQAVAGNGYMYFLGNETTNTDVTYAAINSNNTLGNLYKTVAMPAVHTNGGAVFYNGFIYTFGGCTAFTSGNCTTVSSAIHYSGEQAIARVGHYSKLFNTQVDTAPSQLLVNGTTASGGSVVNTQLRTAQTGQTLGTAQIFNPTILNQNYLVQALDSTGTNVGIAFNYYIFLTLDDSGSGAFPDTGSNVTDLTVFYHANPGRRLRHGASFTNTGCNITPANGCILDSAP